MPAFELNSLQNILNGANRDGNGCLIWNRCVANHGYGMAGYHGKVQLAHRLVWTLTNGAIPDGQCVLHKCDVRRCINIDHLFLGTKKDNYTDMVEKGRRRIAAGVKNGRAKLSAQQIIDIRAARMPTRILAEKYGVHQTTIQRVIAKSCHKDEP